MMKSNVNMSLYIYEEQEIDVMKPRTLLGE